jgi:hypothetical protein
MRLYFIKDHVLRPTEVGAIQRQFVSTINDAAQVVRETEVASRPNVSVRQLEIPTAQAELAQVLTDIMAGEIPVSIVRRSWQGTRRGGLAEIIDGQLIRAPGDSKACKRREAAVAAQPVEDANAFWSRMTASQKTFRK